MSFVSDFIKSSISKVVGAATFPYALGERDNSFDRNSIWYLHKGTKKEDQSAVSIFVFEVAKNKSMLPFAQHAAKKMKTIRHPNLLKYVDTLENDSVIYVVTEPVTPLGEELDQLRSKMEYITWGLYTIAHAVSFLNNNASLIHGNIRLSSVFISQSGEWKLGGLELISASAEPGSWLMSNGGALPDCSRYMPPEVKKSGWASIANNNVWVTDSWMYGCFLYECFNGVFSRSEQLRAPGSIPRNIFPHYERLITQDPKFRPSVAEILQHGTAPSSFFDTDFIQTANFLENITVKDNGEKIKFFKSLPGILEKFPAQFSKYKILPVLINALEFGSAGPKILGTILKIGQNFLSEHEYADQIVGLISRLFNQQDRATRLALLENLGTFSDKVDTKTLNDKLFPPMLLGFNDSAPLLRESTLKAITVVAQQLTDRNINELLRYLAKLQVDEEPGIRANSVICLGKISKYLSSSQRQKVLLAAFTKSLRDPFPPSRSAALMALSATNEYYDVNDCCNSIIPCVSRILLDSEKIVRDQAFKTMDAFIKKVHQHAEAMPTSQMPSSDPNAIAMGSQDQQQPKDATDGWGGWAVSAITKKISEGVETVAAGAFKPSSTSVSPSTAQEVQQPSIKPTPVIIPTINSFSAPVVPQASNSSDGWGNDWGSFDDPFQPQSVRSSQNPIIPKLNPPPSNNTSMNTISSFPSTQSSGMKLGTSLSATKATDRLMNDITSSLSTTTFNVTPNYSIKPVNSNNGWDIQFDGWEDASKKKNENSHSLI